MHYADQGIVRGRHREQQNEQAWCLTVVTNSVVAWHTEYLGLAVAQLRRAGRAIDDEVLAHISPARSGSVNFFGSIAVDYDREIAQFDGTGHRPLRRRRGLTAWPVGSERRRAMNEDGAEQCWCPNDADGAGAWTVEGEDGPGHRARWRVCPDGHGFPGHSPYADPEPGETRARAGDGAAITCPRPDRC
ncbi:Tn3 family transposase [Kitasatospora sp. CM 4170]|uniref:Tn3 family transposase n=1 Tax=Kitasatospora TaxID=2063 RepID=UPI0028B1AC64|nr:Tn3 family transposase [Kitasatospora sp. CM 4170]WNM50297.1 Tn3 family transposase [Kitasatospora sp. CM 4170]